LLLHGEKEMLNEAVTKLGCYPLANQGFSFGKRKFAWVAIGIFVIAIMTSIFGLFPLQLSLGAAVLAMVLLNIIPLRELYDSIDWPVIVLLGGMIPIGAALQSTGTTQLIVDGLLFIAEDAPMYVLLSLLLIITMTLSDILNNAATTILMAPIGATMASELNVSVDPFLMTVAIGASCAFLTPIGHQNNALIMGPGGYQFGDYWRIGLPLEIIILLVSIPLILVVWPI
jgi:di/tricarboxylate transporter